MRPEWPTQAEAAAVLAEDGRRATVTELLHARYRSGWWRGCVEGALLAALLMLVVAR